MAASKKTLQEASILNAGVHGYEDHPNHANLYNFKKQPAEHTAYEDGWNQRAIEIDQERSLHGAARQL
jgi:hypothetical protein